MPSRSRTGCWPSTTSPAEGGALGSTLRTTNPNRVDVCHHPTQNGQDSKIATAVDSGLALMHQLAMSAQTPPALAQTSSFRQVADVIAGVKFIDRN